jgi:putative ABC transport system permease protein
MRQFVDDSLGPRRFTLALFGAFALTAVVVAVVGLYGLVSYTVSQREAEIGLRMAIGATQADVRRMILRQAAMLGGLGTLVGLAIAAAARRPVAAAVVAEIAVSPAMAALAASGLFVVVLAAAWWPARRAARTAPTIALKAP